MSSYVFFHNEWTDTCFLDYDNYKIKRENILNENGNFRILDNEIIIKWDNWDNENIFKLINNKYYLKETLNKYKFIYNDKE